MRLVKDHEIAQFVNLLTSTAKTYGHAQQLREHISATVVDFLEEHNLREKTCTTQTTIPTPLKSPEQETPPTVAEKAQTEQTAPIRTGEDVVIELKAVQVKAYLVEDTSNSAVFLDEAKATDYAVRRRTKVHQLIDLGDYAELQTQFLNFVKKWVP